MDETGDQRLGPVALGLFVNRLEAVCDEMGAVLQRAAFSPNIKDRLDFSCAIFDARGELCAQAAHIPVHLGSMAYAMGDIVSRCEWREGDMVVVNDPYLGGTHLPDVTVIAPLFEDGEVIAFLANRAHHANIGAETPGSMPLSRTLEEEGAVIAPTTLVRDGELDHARLVELLGSDDTADFVAQISANRTGLIRLREVVDSLGAANFHAAVAQLHDYAETMARTLLESLPAGEYAFTDYMDDDGYSRCDIPIAVTLSIAAEGITVDFTGTGEQVDGNINCPLPVAAAAVFYVFRCLMPREVPVCSGMFRPVTLRAPEGTLVNARRPAAVAAGNVETSQRITDAVLGALAQAVPELIPAASHGSMNNVAMGAVHSGGGSWHYYETLGGGMGAGPGHDGISGVQTHMTNTLNTPVESLEMHYPLRVRRYALRRGSGGAGKHRGGDGAVREFEFLQPAQVTLLTERRRNAPWGLAGGEPGSPGENHFNGRPVPGKTTLDARAGDTVTVASAGGGGWGKQRLAPGAEGPGKPKK